MDDSIDSQIANLELSFIDILNSYLETVKKYNDIYYKLELQPSQADVLRKYHSGLLKLSSAAQKIAEAFEAICSTKQVAL